MDVLLTWLRGQLWTKPGGAKDLQLEQIVREQMQERDGRFALDWQPVRVGIVTWN